MSTWVEETNRQFFEVAQAASLKMNKGAFNLILDSRSETEKRNKNYTMKSLILAQDER